MMDLHLRDQIDITPWCIRLAPAAALSAELRSFQNSRGRIDFGDTDSVNAYNRAAFKVMADLELIIPDRNLVPTACLRQAYLTVLLDSILQRGDRILEIGTGATAAIAMLAAKAHGLRVVATEIDPESHQIALQNIRRNQLTEMIDLQLSRGGIIKDVVETTGIRAVLCYPPTYPEADRETYQNEEVGGFKGTESEMIGGGDDGYDFIRQYLDEAVAAAIPVITILLIFESHADLAEDQLSTYQRNIYRIRLNAGTRKRYLIISTGE